MWNNASRSVLVQQYRQNRYTFITVVSLAVILLAFFITYAAFAHDPAALPTLKQIHVIFRHGDRTPTYSYAKDPHKNLKWPEGRGALTRKGKHELFDLGETLRKRYDKFLGDTYHPDLVHMQSSYAPRCQMSGMTFYAGLFPPKGTQIWNPILLWQPIPVNPIPRSIDNLIAAKAYCKKFETDKRKSDQELHASLAEEDQKIFEYLGQNTGEFITDISQAESIYYTLKIQRDNGLELPGWTSEVFPAKLAKLAAINLASYTRTDSLKRLQTGPLLKEIVDHMKHRMENQMKAYFYSGHDLTVVSLMRTLGFDSLDLPEYGAALIFEYHESDDAPGEGFVKVLYFKNSDKDKRKHSFYQMKLPFCEPDCLLTDFVNGIFKYIPVDWQAECKS